MRFAPTRYPLLVGCALGLLLIVAGTLFALLRPTTYTADSVLAVAPENAATESADTVRLVASAYVAYLASPGLAAKTAVDNRLQADEVGAATAVGLDPDTANVRISVTLPSARSAAAVANALADAGAQRGAQDPLVTATVVARAAPTATQVNPPRKLIIIAAVIAGVIIAVVTRAALAGARKRAAASPPTAPVEGVPAPSAASEVTRPRATDAGSANGTARQTDGTGPPTNGTGPPSIGTGPRVTGAPSTNGGAASATNAGGPTAEELRWLRHLADGSTVAQVARTAGYTDRAFYRRLKQVYLTLGTTSRTEALLEANRRGLL